MIANHRWLYPVLLTMSTSRILCCSLFLSIPLVSQAAPAAETKVARAPLLYVLADELDYSMRHLATPDGTKPYFLSYSVTDSSSVSVHGSLGALYRSDDDHQRTLDV